MISDKNWYKNADKSEIAVAAGGQYTVTQNATIYLIANEYVAQNSVLTLKGVKTKSNSTFPEFEFEKNEDVSKVEIQVLSKLADVIKGTITIDISAPENNVFYQSIYGYTKINGEEGNFLLGATYAFKARAIGKDGSTSGWTDIYKLRISTDESIGILMEQ